MKHLSILGIRGIPGNHGGFETFAEYLAPYLVEAGWKVTVYCQVDHDITRGPLPAIWEDEWKGIRRVHIPVKQTGALGTFVFDWKSIRHTMHEQSVILTLGYNTAFMNLLPRLRGRQIIMNMDGIEWKRGKWSFPYKAWFYINELLGCFIAQHLIADHPEVKKHLSRHTSPDKITMIPYGAAKLHSVGLSHLSKWGLKKDKYLISICRLEQENSILELVKAFVKSGVDGKLVILGGLQDDNPYHDKLQKTANSNVIFAGAIYDKEILNSLRCNALCYCHGHTVGGTNPSLVEALGSGSAVIAHDNKYNRWVAGDDQLYFDTVEIYTQKIEEVFFEIKNVSRMRQAASRQYINKFTWDIILEEYRALLEEKL